MPEAVVLKATVRANIMAAGIPLLQTEDEVGHSQCLGDDVHATTEGVLALDQAGVSLRCVQHIKLCFSCAWYMCCAIVESQDKSTLLFCFLELCRVLCHTWFLSWIRAGISRRTACRKPRGNEWGTPKTQTELLCPSLVRRESLQGVLYSWKKGTLENI